MTNEAHDSPPVLAPSQPGTVAIACESTCCLPPELVERYGVSIIPIPLVFGSEAFLDGVDITSSEFYARLASSRTPPQTSPPSPGEYLQVWQRMAERARAIVLVSADGRVTSFERSTCLAAELARDVLPHTAVAVVDSHSAGMGQGFVALAAARAAAAGQPLEEVIQAAERVRAHVRMIVALDTLEYLARASRIPQVAAFVGSVLAIKPIVLFADGGIRQLMRVRTRQRAIQQLVEQLQRMAPPGARLHAAVQHTQAAGEAGELEDRLRGLFNCTELLTTEFTPVMGGYCGPGLLGVAFYTEAGDHEG
jgi:DegV family protein with EDD domain